MSRDVREFYVCCHPECGYTHRLGANEAQKDFGRCPSCGTKLKKECVEFRCNTVVDYLTNNIRSLAFFYTLILTSTLWYFTDYIKELWHAPLWLIAISILNWLFYGRFLDLQKWYEFRESYESNAPKLRAMLAVVTINCVVLFVNA